MERYVTATQKKEFVAWLQSHPSIKQIAEIGLNGGHSAEIFFENCPDLERFISFDIEMHNYTKAAKEYFMKRYKNQFLFIPADSLHTVPKYTPYIPPYGDCFYFYLYRIHWGAKLGNIYCIPSLRPLYGFLSCLSWYRGFGCLTLFARLLWTSSPLWGDPSASSAVVLTETASSPA